MGQRQWEEEEKEDEEEEEEEEYHHHHHQYSFNYGMTECRPHIKNNKQNTKVHKYSVSKRNVTKRSVELELCRPSICFHITCAFVSIHSGMSTEACLA